jgi:molybdenum cofactor cytidylyltransferase
MNPLRAGIIVLAAGASQRMGRPKQLLRFNGRTLIRRAADTALASGCRPVVVTLGAHAELIGTELQSMPVLVAINPDWRQGMSSSLRVGIETLRRAAEVDGVVITLADQPFVSASDIDGLIAVHRLTGKPIVASEYGGGLGVPAFIAAPLFGELATLTGSGGAKALIARRREHVASLPLVDGAVDIDTPADYNGLLRVVTQGAGMASGEDMYESGE